MTGTSCDALDCSLLSIDSSGWSLGYTDTRAYPEGLRARVTALQIPGTQTRIKDLLELNRDLGIWLGDTLSEIIESHPEEVDAIACHGQTVAHFPSEPGGGLTLQLGDLSYLTTLTGITTIGQFRLGDLAAGGQGAPLVPVFHQLLIQSVFRKLMKSKDGIAVHNLGGMSNLSLLTPDDQLFAFDTGPGNFWIDQAASIATDSQLSYDRDGRLGANGKIDAAAVNQILKHPFFSKRFPKSTGRDDFPFEMLSSATQATGPDLVATATEITTRSIQMAYAQLEKVCPISHVVFCGGGTKNPNLMSKLKSLLKPIQCSSMEDWKLNSQQIESQAFAFLGYLALLGLPIGGSWTGAEAFGPPGQILPGTNWKNLQSILKTFLKA